MNLANENPITLEYRRRYNRQPKEIKERLDSFRRTDYQLRVIKKNQPKIAVGDIFLLSPREDIYFYGKVLKTHIRTIDGDTFVEGKQTIFIHKCRSKNNSLESFEPDYDNLLISPSIVDVSYWKKGFFYNIGNLPLTEVEKGLDYGFYKLGIPGIREGWFCTEEGKKLSHQPKIKGFYGVATITGISAMIEQEIIMDSSLIS